MKESQTKRALRTSGLALLLCAAMLIGTTFAWFTDSITNSGNVIQAGKLEITGTVADIDENAAERPFTIEGINNGLSFGFGEALDIEKKDGNGESVNKIIEESLWEPGQSGAKLLTVTNSGSLAAKIKLNFTVKDGGLENALWYDFIQVTNGAITGQLTKRDMSTLKTFAEQMELPLAANTSVQFILVYGMKESAGNEYQGKSFEADVSITAKQDTVETDGFGNPDYDQNAEFAIPVSNEAEFVEAVEKGGTIELKDDIALANEYLEVQKDLTIVGNGKSLTAPASGDKKDRVINVTGTTEPVTLTLQNVDIKGPETGTYNRGISFYNTGEVNLIMDNCSVSTNYYAINIASECKDVNVTLRNTTLTGYAALQTHSPNAEITLENCVLTGNNNFAKDDWNRFATVVINQTAGNTKLVLNNCTIQANNPTGNTQYYLSVRSENNVIELNNCKYVYNGTEQTLEEAMKNVQLYSTNNSIKVDGVEVVEKQ